MTDEQAARVLCELVHGHKGRCAHCLETIKKLRRG